MTSADRHVLLRVDAGMGIGLGHLTRCLSLARQLLARGIRVTVATRAQESQIVARIHAAGVGVHFLTGGSEAETADGPVWLPARQRSDAAAVLEAAPLEGWDAVVVDHYRLDRTWEEEIARATRRVVVIDDLANRQHSANVIVDHNWYGNHTQTRYVDLAASETTLLLGPRFAMLHPNYAEARVRRDPVEIPPVNVLVNFGGTDVGKQTVKAVRALVDEPGLSIEVAVGTPSALTSELRDYESHPRVTIHVGLPDLVDLLSKADLVIGAGGTATWERLCMGVPALVTTVSENQSGVTRAFDEAHITRWLGVAQDVTVLDYRRAVEEALAGGLPSVLPIVDGHGAARVSFAVVPPETGQLTVREARLQDAPSFVTAGPGCDGPEVWRHRSRSFKELMNEPGALELIMLGQVPVGTRRHFEGGIHEWHDRYLDLVITKQENP